ncbi:TPA: site-specific integrase [Candidatus Poribacteria bacterium]|nr:site-specific integrase [Candidatus Poribacteria bacterium]
MKGSRPPSQTEIESVARCFWDDYTQRHLALFMLGVSVGGRISELLALNIGDVYQNN